MFNILIFLCLFSAVEIQNNGYIEGDFIIDGPPLRNPYHEKILDIHHFLYENNNNTERIYFLSENRANTGRFHMNAFFIYMDFCKDNNNYIIDNAQYIESIMDHTYKLSIYEYTNGSITVIENPDNSKTYNFNISFKNIDNNSQIKDIKGFANHFPDKNQQSEQIYYTMSYFINFSIYNMLKSKGPDMRRYLKYFYWIGIETKKKCVKERKKEYPDIFKKLELQDDGTIIVEYNKEKKKK